MRKSLVSIGFGLLLLITGIFISNLIIDLNNSEPTYNNNSLTSVYIELVKNDSNKIEIERNGKLQSSNRISIISEVQGIKKKNRNKSFKEGERFNKDETLIKINSDEFNSTVKQSRSELKNLIASVLPDIKIDYAENFNNWKNYFDSLPSNPSGADTSHAKVIERFRNYKSKAPSVKPINEKQIRVLQLIQSYRNRGHMKSSLDPLNLQEHVQCDDLTLEYHGLNQEDLGSIFQTDTLNIGKDSASLSEIIQSLERIYCNTLGIEYNYITSEVERKWFQSRLEPGVGKNTVSYTHLTLPTKRIV